MAGKKYSKAERKVYEDYIKHSPIWKEKARKIRERDGVCRRCESGKQLHVHHKHYRSLGCELDSDLVLLCKSCHDKLHKLHSKLKRKWGLEYLTDMFVKKKERYL